MFRIGSMRSALTATAITLGLAVLSACGGARDGGGSTQSGGTAAAESTVTFSIANPPTQLDPIATKNETADLTYLSPLFDGLTGLTDEKVAPRLAESYEASEDGLTWTFKLRNGARFHDGTPIDAAAVVANMQRALDARETNGILKSKLARVSGVEAADEMTVVFKLSEPDPGLPATLAGPSLGIGSPAAFSKMGTAPVGSGPYVFESMSADRVVYKRFQDYWDSGVAKADKLVVLSIPDGKARMNALRSGQIDAANAQTYLSADIKEFQADPKFQVVEEESQSVMTLYLNTTHAPLDNPNVRRALNYAIDREAINRDLLGGFCPPTNQPFPNGTGFVESVEGAYTYDPDKARQILKEEGITELKLEAIFLTSGTSQAIAPAIQAQMAKAGIQLKLTGVNSADARPIFRSGKPDAMVHQVNAELDPSLTLKNNFLGLDSPGGVPDEIEKIANEAIKAPLDSAERAQALAEFSKAIVETPTHVHICAVPSYFVGKTSVIGLDTMPWRSMTLNTDPRTLGIDH